MEERCSNTPQVNLQMCTENTVHTYAVEHASFTPPNVVHPLYLHPCPRGQHLYSRSRDHECTYKHVKRLSHTRISRFLLSFFGHQNFMMWSLTRLVQPYMHTMLSNCPQLTQSSGKRECSPPPVTERDAHTEGT